MYIVFDAAKQKHDMCAQPKRRIFFFFLQLRFAFFSWRGEYDVEADATAATHNLQRDEREAFIIRILGWTYAYNFTALPTLALFFLFHPLLSWSRSRYRYNCSRLYGNLSRMMFCIASIQIGDAYILSGSTNATTECRSLWESWTIRIIFRFLVDYYTLLVR